MRKILHVAIILLIVMPLVAGCQSAGLRDAFEQTLRIGSDNFLELMSDRLDGT